ncbi:hypothetical protein F4821DRAFT_241558 [Hypoxylon rubiginosum]|uniref:Uncharacterized protein n=1 Tax=Hypoxylon rubiginosum TaxID=110542 RepID=A0ACC0CXR7_9PEZI|nr:hypothetical protein F4821DRAFT_241558 [Hypoxylon rubiginosum]
MASNDHGQAGGQGLTEFVDRYKQYMQQKENTHEFIRDLLVYADGVESKLRTENSQLLQILNDTRLDLDDATKSRRDLQLRLRDLETRLGVIPDRNPYVMVLIDGDGLLFKEHLVRQGVVGGRKAAEELRKAVTDKFSYDEDTAIEVVAEIVANVSGLSKAMKRDGCLDDESILYEFISGFNQAKVPFNFIDVGYSKEAADAKLLCSARFHLRNFNCKLILMGVSHDGSYAPYLDHLIHDDTGKQRIAVLEGCPTVEDIVATGITITSFKTIFRSDKLRVPSPQIETPTTTTTAQTMSPPPSVSYAAITQTKASPPPQITLPIPLKRANTPARTLKPFTPAWNPGPRGLDPPIQVNPAALERLKKRKGSDKLCNNHFLRGPCTKGDECDFEHNYNPTKEEKAVIALFARLSPCTKGQECDIDNCIYGHHCPSVVAGVCVHPHCKFRVDEHPPGTKFKHARHADWN